MLDRSHIIQSISRQLDFNLAYAKKLVEDLTEEQMTTIPGNGFENHPAFTLGHLVSGMSLMVIDDISEVKKPGFMPDGWKELFLRRGPGDPRTPEEDKTKYPSKEELLAELERKHNMFKDRLMKFTDEDLLKEKEWRFYKYMNSNLDSIIFMCANHEAMHLGQLSAWRRAIGLDSALAKL